MYLTGTPSDMITQILAIFTAIGNWFVESVTSMTALFYVPETGLTVVGVLAICGLAVGVILLLINTVKRFFRWG